MNSGPATVNPTTVRDLAPFSFQGLDLKESCWVNGTPFSSGRAIGELLEYEYPNQAIRKIIDRNPHINDPRWSVVVRLGTTDGKKYETRVYNPIGVQLIMFESQQPKARAYKVAVANFVWAYMNDQLRPPVDPGYGPQLRALDLVPHGQKTLAVEVLAEARHCVRATIYRHRAMDRKGQDPSAKRYPTLIDRWDRRFPREKALAIAAREKGWPTVRIHREALGSPLKPTLYMVGALVRRMARMQVPESAQARGEV